MYDTDLAGQGQGLLELYCFLQGLGVAYYFVIHRSILDIKFLSKKKFKAFEFCQNHFFLTISYLKPYIMKRTFNVVRS